jgi:predicted ATP-dependent endonuclease of OLD family
MYIARLTIKNFRGIRSADVKLGKHFILLGTNNSGKSTIVDAIGLVLGKESLVRSIGDYDFFGGNPKPDDRIIIKALLTDFNNNEVEQEADWFNDNNGGIPKWFDEETCEIFTEQNNEKSLKLAVEIAFAARFDKEDLEFETKRFFVLSDIDPFEDDDVIGLNRNHLKNIGFFLLPSKRNWEKIISFGSELFRKVVNFQDAIPAESICQIRNDLRENEHGIEKEAPFTEIVQRINKELEGFSGKSQALNFLPTNADIESTLKSITPFLKGNGDTILPLGNHGSGVISLQTLLLLLEFGRFRKDNSQNFIIAAEEPELHLHPGMHRRLVGRIRSLSTQTIITTHSPEIAAYYKPQEIHIIHTSHSGESKVSPLLNSSTPPQNALMKLFTVYRQETSEALMRSNVIIPEGLTEFHWLNKLVNACITTEGWEVQDSINSFGVIPTQDSNVHNTYKVLNHLNVHLLPLVDGDAAGDTYVNNFIGDSNCPKFILQLPNNKFLEHILAWIIKPDAGDSTDELKSIFDGSVIDYTSIDELGNLLESKYKSYWKMHDDIIEYIIKSPNCISKARLFLEALNCIHFNSEESHFGKYWKINTDKSNESVKVLTLSIF